jgi:hypothetical protein
MGCSKIIGFLFFLALGLCLLGFGVSDYSNPGSVTCGGVTMSPGDSCDHYSNGSSATYDYAQQQGSNQSRDVGFIVFGVLCIIGSFFALRNGKTGAMNAARRLQVSQYPARPIAVASLSTPIATPALSPQADDSLQPYYKVFGQMLEKSGATGPFTGVLVVSASDQEIGQIVYLQLKHAWLAKKQEDIIYAYVQAYTVSGKTIPAAVFEQVEANNYMLWGLQHQPGEVVILSSKATIKNLSSTPTTTSQQVPLQPVNIIQASGINAGVSIAELPYEVFCRQLEQNGATGPYAGALVVRLPDQQIGQVIYLQLQHEYLKQTRTDLYTASVQRYSVGDHSVTVALFQQISANMYMVWMDHHQPITVNIKSSKAILVEFS